MKKLNFIVFFIFFLISIFDITAQKNVKALQEQCPVKTDKTNLSGEKAIWDILLEFETTSSSQGGVATDGKYIYTSSFSTDMFRKFELDGTFIEEFSIPGVPKVGCLTYDGTFFYGARGPIENGIFMLDLENHVLVSTVSVSAPSIVGLGHISFDPELDGGNGGFWTGYWAELAAVDMNGNEIIANVVTTMPGIAGTAYDNITDPANPCLFCFQQTGSSNLEITRFDINTHTFSDVLHVATDISGPSGGSSNSVASGMNSFVNSNGKLVLLGLIDCFPGNEMIFEYEISNNLSYTNDVSIESLISPVTSSNLTANEDVTVRILNNGTASVSGFDIQYTINDGIVTYGPFSKTISGSINPGDFVNITFDEQADLSNSGTEYTIVITSLLSGDENNENDILTKSVTNIAGMYCDASGGSSASSEHISNVSIGSVSNSSGADHYADYSDDTNLFIYLESGVAAQLTVTNGHGYNANNCAVWIDWNNNGDFYNTGENVFVSAMGQGPYITDITAPGTALQGTNLRMRIRIDYNQPNPDPCGSTSFGEVEDYTIIVVPEGAYGGTAVAEPVAICTSGTTDLNLLGWQGDDMQWQNSSDGNTWADISGAVTPAYTTSTLNSDTYFRAQVNKSGFSSEYSNVLLVSISTPPVSGTASVDNDNVCEGDMVTVTLTGYTGDIQWQNSSDGTTWSDNIGFNDETEISYPLNENIYYRAEVSTPGCNSAYSNSEFITVNDAPENGTATVDDSNICTGSSATITLTGSTGDIQWQNSADGIIWTDITGANSAIYDTENLTETTYYKAILTLGQCDANSNRIIITTVENPIADFSYTANNQEITFTNTSSEATSYNWDFGDGNSSTEENPVYTYSASDTYTIILTASNGICSDDNYSEDITVNYIGVENIDAKGIIVYPNPVYDVLNVISQNNNIQNIKLFNNAGELVFEEYVFKKENIINISDYKSGIYLLQVNEGKMTYYKRVIIISK